jgi:hypothetical protein
MGKNEKNITQDEYKNTQLFFNGFEVKSSFYVTLRRKVSVYFQLFCNDYLFIFISNWCNLKYFFVEISIFLTFLYCG